MKIELIDWYQLDGKVWPRIRLSDSRSAKRFRLDPACSNELQKMQEKRNRTPIAAILIQSSRVSFACSFACCAAGRSRGPSALGPKSRCPRKNCTRPKTIPKPAIAKPKCHPSRGSIPCRSRNPRKSELWARNPQTSGAIIAPMLMPM